MPSGPLGATGPLNDAVNLPRGEGICTLQLRFFTDGPEDLRFADGEPLAQVEFVELWHGIMITRVVKDDTKYRAPTQRKRREIR